MEQASASRRTLAAIMFADIVGFTAMMQENEAHARTLRDKYLDILTEKIQAHAGEIIQNYGDGTLSIFGSAKEAVLAGCAMQRALRSAPEVPVRIGIHLGDIVRDANGIYGDGVNVASRIESLGVPGGVLYSDKVARELENHPSLISSSLGEFHFKNVRQPVEVFAAVDEAVVVPAREQLAAGKTETRSKTIAVLPFDQLSGSDESDYFAEGVSDGIANGLSKVEGISTISRTTCQAIKQDRGNLSAIRDKLRVSHILEGTVRTAGNRVRVSVQLINTNDGFQVWSEMIDKDLHDIFDVQDEIAHQVVHGLKVQFDTPSATQAIVTKQTHDPAAYKLYLKGLYHLGKNNPDDGSRAIEMLNQALELDGDFPAARCALSNCYAFLGSCGVINPIDAFSKAHRNALDAIEQNPKLAEAHLSIAILKFYHYWDWKGAYESLEKACALGLNSALMHQTYALYYAAIGDHEAGIERMAKALALDPLSVPVMNALGMLYLFNEQYEKCIAVYDEILELDPTFRSAIQAKALALSCQGKIREGLVLFEEYHRMVNHPDKALIGLSLCYHALGETDKVDEYLGRLHRRLEREGGGPAEIDLGIIYCGLGDARQGFAHLNRVYDKRFSIACMGMIWVIRCPYFNMLWDHPEYLNLVRRMELQPSRLKTADIS